MCMYEDSSHFNVTVETFVANLIQKTRSKLAPVNPLLWQITHID